MMKNQSKSKLILTGTLLAFLSIAIAVFASFTLYKRTTNILTENLRSRLLTISTMAAANIDAKDLSELRTEEDWHKPEWSRVVNTLHRAKYSNEDIVFMYIFRKKADDESQMEFVADADSIDPFALVDVNRDGKVEVDGPDKLQWPGQDYPEAADIPETFEAYNSHLTSADLYTDEYGTVLTGYAPIKDENGETVAVLATDIKANDFYTITTSTLYPFIVFIILLVLLILILTALLIISTLRALKKDLEQVKRIKELNDARSDFLRVASHQLRTPVSLITGTLSEFVDGGSFWELPQADKQKMINAAYHKAKKLTNIINGILAASRMESFQEFSLPASEKVEDIDVRKLLTEICNDMQEKAANKKLELDYSSLTASTVPIFVKGSENYLEQAFTNLIDNAINYTQQGFVRVGMSYEPGKVVITIADSGIGIPIEDQGKLFGKFERAKNAVNAYADGSGLGLFVVKKVIEAHPNGKISFKSDGDGKGTTFTIELNATEKL